MKISQNTELASFSPMNIKVLAYHAVKNAENFEKQLIYLKKRYTIIDASNLDNFSELPENPLLITFDDGDISVRKVAFPVLQKYNIPSVLFVVTELINTKKPFWWDEIKHYLGEKEGNQKTWEVKEWPNAKREAFLEQLRKESSKPRLEYQQLSSDELKEMQAEGMCIANHSHTHPMFDQCTDQELENELRLSTNRLSEFGFRPDVFAYPNGNFSERSEKKLKQFGINLAFLFDHKINSKATNPLRISRLVVNDDTPLWKFKFILSGWHTKILPITKTLGKIRK